MRARRGDVRRTVAGRLAAPTSTAHNSSVRCPPSPAALLAACLVASGACISPHPSPGVSPRQPVVRIRFGESAGMCVGYCSSTTTIDGRSVTRVDSAWNDKVRYPPLAATGEISPQEWAKLQHAVDRDTLLALPSSMGCPGCADQPVGWVEVDFADGTKKEVAYNAGRAPPQLASLLRELEMIGSDLRKALPKH